MYLVTSTEGRATRSTCNGHALPIVPPFLDSSHAPLQSNIFAMQATRTSLESRQWTLRSWISGHHTLHACGGVLYAAVVKVGNLHPAGFIVGAVIHRPHIAELDQEQSFVMLYDRPASLEFRTPAPNSLPAALRVGMDVPSCAEKMQLSGPAHLTLLSKFELILTNYSSQAILTKLPDTYSKQHHSSPRTPTSILQPQYRTSSH